jgi:phosphoribosylformimino-5-aminoimidazole carboxamide ribotide isomerase
MVKDAVAKYGSEAIAVAIDEKDGKVAVHGWQNKSEIGYVELAKFFEDMGIGAIIYTPISVDGTLKGPEVQKTVDLIRTVSVPVIASGGVAELDDLVALSKTGAAGVIVGTAIYEKKFTVKEALDTVKNVS